METKEIERTFLAKYLPIDLDISTGTVIQDYYAPTETEHPQLRLRNNGNHYEVTKKQPIITGDSSQQLEETIGLTKDEFTELTKPLTKGFKKLRVKYNHLGLVAEFDIYKDGLCGLVVVDFEFEDEGSMNSFKMPDFCLAEVTQDRVIAGGMLAGKTYQDIEPTLKKYDYKPIMTKE